MIVNLDLQPTFEYEDQRPSSPADAFVCKIKAAMFVIFLCSSSLTRDTTSSAGVPESGLGEGPQAVVYQPSKRDRSGPQVPVQTEDVHHDMVPRRRAGNARREETAAPAENGALK